MESSSKSSQYWKPFTFRFPLHLIRSSKKFKITKVSSNNVPNQNQDCSFGSLPSDGSMTVQPFSTGDRETLMKSVHTKQSDLLFLWDSSHMSSTCNFRCKQKKTKILKECEHTVKMTCLFNENLLLIIFDNWKIWF